jgi:hypothetical protein
MAARPHDHRARERSRLVLEGGKQVQPSASGGALSRTMRSGRQLASTAK